MKKAVFLFVLLLFAGLTANAQSDIDRRLPDGRPSDNCTLFPDGDWADCCIAHDIEYFHGGTGSMRKAADRRLRQCVAGKGHKVIARIMYIGVRVGGVGFLKLPFSWGFGKRRRPPAQPLMPIAKPSDQ